MLVFAITTQCGSFRNNIKQARNVVCYARCGRLRERAGGNVGPGGRAYCALWYAYQPCPVWAAVAHGARGCPRAISLRALFAAPALLPRRSEGMMHARHCQLEACIPAIYAVLSSRGLSCGCQTKECVPQVACSQLLYLAMPLGRVCALQGSAPTASDMRICSA